MKAISCCLLTLLSLTALSLAAPVRVLIQTDDSSAGRELTQRLEKLLPERGAQLAKTLEEAEVAVLYAAEMKAPGAPSKQALTAFAERGGGLVVLHGAVASSDPTWWQSVTGGAWSPERSRKFSSRTMLYVATDQHPIVAGASAFDVTDETLYDLDLQPEVKVLASAFTPKITGRKGEAKGAPGEAARANIYDLQPQLWAYESGASSGRSHRAVVALPGTAETLRHNSMQAFLLRGIAWAAGREKLDELCAPTELAALRYPAGGPLTPEATAAQFQLHPDFTASVVAAEPLINKPIAVQWDAAGRLWVAETPEYPNGRRPLVTEAWKETGVLDPSFTERPARDRISILSEPDAAGRFTKKHVFFEGLELVTGFCLYGDGVIALAEPDIVFIHGEGAAQRTERLFTGFTPGDTHFVGNHLIVAPDGWIYASMGGSAEVKNPATGQNLSRVTAGLFRFRPDGSAIEQVSSKNGNGFGADLTSDGELFFGQATSGNPIQHVALPESLLARGKVGTEGGAQSVIKGRKVVVPALPDRVPLMQIDVVGGYSAACSSLVYEGGAWPAEWTKSIFCTEPILNIIHSEALRPSGSTYTGEMVRTEAEFLHSPDYWFRPIDVTFGPDGALYVLDFYNPVIAHSDTRGPLHSKAGASIRPDREHYFGRIYRLQHKQAKTLTVPDLSKAAAPELAAALSHENRVVRANAFRLLMEKAPSEAASALTPIASPGHSAEARALALWGLQRTQALSSEILRASLRDADATVRKTAALVLETRRAEQPTTELIAGLHDADPRVQIAMLRALAASKLDAASAQALVETFPTLKDDLAKSAAVAAASANPAAVVAAAFRAQDPASVRDLVINVAAGIAERNEADTFAKLTNAMADAPASANELKRLVLESAATLKSTPSAPVEALRALLSDPQSDLAAAALPLAVQWGAAEPLKAQVQAVIAARLPELSSDQTPEARRAQAITSLIGARAADDQIWASLRELLLSSAADNLKRRAVSNLADSGDAKAGALLIAAFDHLPGTSQAMAFDALLARPEWTTAFLDAAEGEKLKLSVLGPANLFRLRTHPNKEIAQRATAVVNRLMKPNADKEKVIAELAPIVSQPGNAAHGKELFTATCAICHKLGDLGKEIGPVLTGIGAHGPEQLLVSIVDPNRQIDAGFETYNVETKDGQVQAGLLAQENDARLVLRSQTGDVEIAKSNIKTSQNTHRSLMPEGFEALGGDALRDILTFLCGADARYRVLDLTQAYTADTRHGLYQSQDHLNDTVTFKKFGLVNVEGVPFQITNPESSALGGNLIVLRGGPRESFAHTLPDHVEIPVNLPAKAFHFLGGIAGWGSSKADPNGRPAMNVTAIFADGQKETTIVHNGVEIADYIRPIDVPGSRLAEDIVKNKQIRWFTIPVKHQAVVQKLILDSPGNGPAVTTAGITAEVK